MKITTAKEKFDYAIWHVLDRLERERLPYPNKKVVDYMMNINIEYQAHFLFGLERDVIKFLKDKKVIKQVGEPDIYESDPGFSKYEVYEIYHFEILNKFNDYYRKYTNLLRGGLDITQLFGFRNKTFWLKLIDGSEVTINFNPKGNRKHPAQPYYLLRAFVNATIMRGSWERKDSWIEISLTRQEIIDGVKKLHHPDTSKLNSYWITNTRNNLIKNTVPQNIRKLMNVSYYDIKSRTYTFSLKVSL